MIPTVCQLVRSLIRSLVTLVHYARCDFYKSDFHEIWHRCSFFCAIFH